jgi:hypothetical protein
LHLVQVFLRARKRRRVAVSVAVAAVEAVVVATVRWEGMAALKVRRA